ncbi:hypothetical protein ABLN72_01525, partial [Mycobacterium tuberculosis]
SAVPVLSGIWVFNLQASQHFHCFRIYRETLSRFSCAATAWALEERFALEHYQVPQELRKHQRRWWWYGKRIAGVDTR